MIVVEANMQMLSALFQINTWKHCLVRKETDVDELPGAKLTIFTEKSVSYSR